MTSLWGRADFRALIAALGISQMGAKVAREALPLTAVLALGAGPLAMSGLSIAASLPTLLMALHAGAFLDRIRRRPSMIIADLLRFLLLVSIPVAAFFDLDFDAGGAFAFFVEGDLRGGDFVLAMAGTP